MSLYFLFLALWMRLANRFNDSLPYPKPFMEQVWIICTKVKDFQFYELETPRDSLVIFDRYEHVHPDLGIIQEPVSILKYDNTCIIFCMKYFYCKVTRNVEIFAISLRRLSYKMIL